MALSFGSAAIFVLTFLDSKIWCTADIQLEQNSNSTTLLSSAQYPEKRVRALETLVASQAQAITALTDEIQKQQETITKLSHARAHSQHSYEEIADHQTMREATLAISARIDLMAKSHELELQDVKARIREHEKTLQLFQMSFNSYEMCGCDRYPGIAERLEYLNRQVDRLEGWQSYHSYHASSVFTAEVSFSAYPTNGVATYGSGDTVLFEGAEINEGGHFNPASSRFTCPASGLYFFSVNLLLSLDSPQGYGGQVSLMKGSEAQATIQALTINSYLDAMCSHSVLVTCSVGEEVFVQATATTTVGSANRLSTFSGLLMKLL